MSKQAPSGSSIALSMNAKPSLLTGQTECNYLISEDGVIKVFGRVPRSELGLLNIS